MNNEFMNRMNTIKKLSEQEINREQKYDKKNNKEIKEFFRHAKIKRIQTIR